jgi:hypothetical protein
MRPKDPIEELRESCLFKRLKELSEDYAQRAVRFVSEIAPVLATTSRFFPYYTRHDANHGYRVLRRIEQILKPSCFASVNDEALSATELFLLIASAYAHDLGMTVFPGEEKALAESISIPLDPSWETNPKLQSYLRKNHSKRGGEYIYANAERLQVPTNLIAALDWMMKSHNLSIPELDQNLSFPFAAEERVIDVRQISIILCIADAIEFSDTRVIEGVLDLISKDETPEARISYRENMKHVCISDSLAIDADGRIVISGTFDDPAVVSLAHHSCDQIEEWIRGYCDIDRRSAVKRLLVRPEPLQRRFELLGARFERLGVRISKRNIIDLISSNAVWRTDRGVAIRELVQNSVEACRYRKFHSAPSDFYAPEVSVAFNRSDKTVTIKDNGCGMSERVVLDHFLTVGNSRANEKAYVSESYASIARFGIGFWSVFTVAEKARIETAPFEDKNFEGFSEGVGFEVELGDLKDYTVFSHLERSAGTTITLSLKDEMIIDEIFEQARKQILCSEVPLEFTLDDEVARIPVRTPSVSDANILLAMEPRKTELGIETFQWEGAVGDTELALGVGYRTKSGRATFLDEDNTPLLLAKNSIRSPQQAVCGFLVTLPFGKFCFDVSRVGTYFANYQTPRGIEFSLDRRGLLVNEASHKFSNEIRDLIHKAYREFLKRTASQNVETIFNLNDESRMNGGNIVDTFTGDELSVAYLNYPDLLCFKLWRVDVNVLDFRQVTPSFFDLQALTQQSATIFVIQNSYAIPVGGGRLASFPAESLLPFAYLYALREMREARVEGVVYVATPDRAASMLFDCDRASTVEFFDATLPPIQSSVSLCIQRIALDNVRVASLPEDILAEVTGSWSGAIYLREFKAPSGKPYVFLGRHRVVIQKSSRLRSFLEDLKGKGRLIKLAGTIALLKDDEGGFTPPSLESLL